jgi:hypothetical protein
MSRRDRIVAESIEEAMRPYLGVLPEEALTSMRDILEEAMETHPVALEALDAIEARPAVDRSGTRVRRDGSEDDDGEAGGLEGGS